MVDLGELPAANALISSNTSKITEPLYSHRVWICEDCGLVQLPNQPDREKVFGDDYVYFSSYSQHWLKHAEMFVSNVTREFGLGSTSMLMEIGSNDGYLLQFARQRGVPCLGIEPARDPALAARKKGVQTLIKFFGRQCAEDVLKEYGGADLVCGANVLAHVPDLNDFVSGLSIVIKPLGIVTMEFPHLLRLLEQTQFDTIYNEHYSYLSASTTIRIFKAHGLKVFRIEEWPTHGGSLRVFACRESAGNSFPVEPSVSKILSEESRLGLFSFAIFDKFRDRVNTIRNTAVAFLDERKRAGNKIAAYGAAAKGTIFLNYCKLTDADILFVADDTPVKQGKYLPVCRVPIVSEDIIKKEKPNVIIILPWNHQAEIKEKLSYTKNWNCELVNFLPELTVS